MIEIWKDIEGFEGSHQISNLGRVRSIDRDITRCNQFGEYTYRFKGRIMRLHKMRNGYLGVVLEAKGKTFLVHRLVANAFIPNLKNLREVNHKDLVRDHNHEDNLEWVSSRRNKLHSYESGTRKQHGLTQAVALVRAGERLEFSSILEAANHFGRSPGSVSSAHLRDHLFLGYQVICL